MKLLLIFVFISFIAFYEVEGQGVFKLRNNNNNKWDWKNIEFKTGFQPSPDFGQLMSLTWKRVSKTPEYSHFVNKNGGVDNLSLDPEWNRFFQQNWDVVENELKRGRHWNMWKIKNINKGRNLSFNKPYQTDYHFKVKSKTKSHG